MTKNTTKIGRGRPRKPVTFGRKGTLFTVDSALANANKGKRGNAMVSKATVYKYVVAALKAKRITDVEHLVPAKGQAHPEYQYRVVRA